MHQLFKYGLRDSYSRSYTICYRSYYQSCDSMATHIYIKDTKYHGKSKHIETHYHYILTTFIPVQRWMIMKPIARVIFQTYVRDLSFRRSWCILFTLHVFRLTPYKSFWIDEYHIYLCLSKWILWYMLIAVWYRIWILIYHKSVYIQEFGWTAKLHKACLAISHSN